MTLIGFAVLPDSIEKFESNIPPFKNKAKVFKRHTQLDIATIMPKQHIYQIDGIDLVDKSGREWCQNFAQEREILRGIQLVIC